MILSVNEFTMNQRNVIHIDIADFHIAVERVLEPRLRERPVVVAIQTATRSLVYSASREARENGVYRGMPLQQALKNCRDLIVLPPNQELYMRATSAMINILGQFTPVIEPLRFGHAYLDMTGSGRLFGGVKDAAAKAQHEIRERLRLHANAGVASNKLVSKVASDVVTHAGKCDRLCDVRHGYEERFLAPLYVHYLPGVKKTVRQQLLDLNVRLIRDLVTISVENLQMVFGRFGLLLHQRAHGIDNRPVQPPKRAPEIIETETLPQDSNDYDLLRAIAYRLLSQATRRLRYKQLHAGRLVIEIRYSDYKENMAQKRILSTDDEQELAPALEDVLERAVNRRVRVRKVTLRLCNLSRPSFQMSLFGGTENPRMKALTAAMDKIRDRYGEQAIRFGRAA